MIYCGNARNSQCCSGDHSLQASLLRDTSPSARPVLSRRPIDCVSVAVIQALLILKMLAHVLLLYRIQVSLHQGPLGVSLQTEEALRCGPEETMIVC